MQPLLGCSASNGATHSHTGTANTPAHRHLSCPASWFFYRFVPAREAEACGHRGLASLPPAPSRTPDKCRESGNLAGYATGFASLRPFGTQSGTRQKARRRNPSFACQNRADKCRESALASVTNPVESRINHVAGFRRNRRGLSGDISPQNTERGGRSFPSAKIAWVLHSE